MRTRFGACLAVVAAIPLIVAGCSAGAGAGGDGDAPGPSLQLRVVTSSTYGPCSAPPLASDDPGSACDRAGTTTYELAELLGVVTPASVTHDDRESRAVNVEFDSANAGTLTDALDEAAGQQLALLLDGQVLSAPTVAEGVVIDRAMEFGFGTAAEAEQFVVDMGASATS